MAKNELNECSICFGNGTLRCAYGHSIDTAKAFWVECACGLRTTICDTPEEAVSLWNWLNRSTKEKEAEANKKAVEHKRIKESIEKDEKATKKLVKERIKISKEAKVIKKEDVIIEKPKRHRRTKAEMQALRASNNVAK